MKIAVCGGVVSTEILIRKLQEIASMKVKVWGFHPKETDTVSGWVDLQRLCLELNVEYESFITVGSIEASLKDYQPDVLFVVGLSQIVSNDILDIASVANIGFHPTALPKGRGRAAVAWMILDQLNGAATFFLLTEGVDDGPIVSQTHFEVVPEDTAKEVETKVLAAMEVGLASLLPNLKSRIDDAVEQDETEATWYGRRTPSDGWVNWSSTVNEICSLVRASAPPHPGAKTVSKDSMVILLKADKVARAEKGVVGRILQVFDDSSFTVQASDGVVRITQWRCDKVWRPAVGALLGYNLEEEIFLLRAYCEKLEKKIDSLQSDRL